MSSQSKESDEENAYMAKKFRKFKKNSQSIKKRNLPLGELMKTSEEGIVGMFIDLEQRN